jgi:hypothetical protein
MSANLSWRCEEVAFAVSFVPFKFSAASRVARCEGLGLSIFSQALAPFRCSLLSQHDNATKPNRESRQKFESTIGSCSQTLKGKFRPKGELVLAHSYDGLRNKETHRIKPRK